MTALRRWCLVALGSAVIVTGPLALRALPAEDPDISAAELLAVVQQSGPVGYSGFAESVGNMQLPVTDQLSDLAQLLGERSRLRVWWRGYDDWRVDSITTAGETDTIHSGSVTTTWDYEGADVTRSLERRIRLPRSSDLLPPQLGRLVLADARPDEVTALPAERIAGIDAAGLRLVPAERQSTVDHVDVWADAATGLPVRVEGYAKGEVVPSVSTSFVSLDVGAPSAETTDFSPPPGADLHTDDVIDVADGADTYAPVVAARRVAGLTPRPGAVVGSAVGEYGRGVTTLIAIPLWDRSADPLRDQLLDTPGAVVDDGGISLTVGPLDLRLSSHEFFDHHWLVAGTVTQPTLRHAIDDLLRRSIVQVDQ